MNLTNFGPPSGPENDALALLRACHERIRYFTGLAQKLARAEKESSEAVRMGAEALLRYFGKALPLHSADEDDSLAPRLARCGFGEGLEDLSEEHKQIHRVLHALQPLWRRVSAEPETLNRYRSEILQNSIELKELFDKHLSWEEENLFPAAEERLSEADRAEIFAEMKARRRAQ